MRVLICGGTDFLSRHIANALVQQDHAPVVRSCHSDPSLDFAQLESPQDWRSHLQGMDAVINAVSALRDKPGENLKALRAHPHHHAPQYHL